MTTPDPAATHAAEAERLIRSSGEFMRDGDAAAADRCLATAQVHAILAKTAPAAFKTLLDELTKLTTSWLTEAAGYMARANRLGDCAAGKDAFGDASMLRQCAAQLASAVNTAVSGQ